QKPRERGCKPQAGKKGPSVSLAAEPRCAGHVGTIARWADRAREVQAANAVGFTDVGARAMNDRVNPRIARRDVLRVLAIGAATATTSACTTVEAEHFADKRKAHYQADSPEVQTFYRVNRYPAR